MKHEVTKFGKRGTIVIPATLRRRFDFHDGDLVIAEERDEGILLRRAVAVPIETYSAERKAEFLLSNAVDLGDYKQARKAVKKLGLDPDKIPHHKPKE